MRVRTCHRDRGATNGRENERDARLSESKLRINTHSQVIN